MSETYSAEPPATRGPGLLARLGASRSLSIIGKLFFIGIVIYLLLAAISMVRALVFEREHRADEVASEIAKLWGQPQFIRGPVLAVPFGVAGELPGAEYATIQGMAYFLPSTLDIHGTLEPEIRRRGLFDTAVYTLNAQVRGEFPTPGVGALRGLVPNPDEVILVWERARMLVGLSDLRGMRSNTVLTLGGRDFAFRPGAQHFVVTSQGMNADVSTLFTDGNTDSASTLPFSFAIELNGSRRARIAPFADETKVSLTSSWPSPSFEGEFLPIEHSISDEGFEADWHVSHFARGFTNVLVSTGLNQEMRQKISNATFGVSLYQPVTPYRKVQRAIKYGLLFLVFTFGFYFLVELATRQPIHPIQYATVGIPLCLFFLLLVAFAEHLGFAVAYAAGTAAVVSLVAFYSYRMLRSAKRTILITALLSGMYAFLYSLLELESYSLLSGAIGLWVLTAIFMFVTRRINWYGTEEKAHA
ncbi:MAG: cell envelope integrity protein CreD [Pseudomonadota bacterium]